MPKVMKPPTEYDSNDIDTGGGDWYDGPPPPPGFYKGKVVKLLLTKVSSGDRAGEQRIMVVCEISEGQYKGAGVIKWLQLTKQGSPWLNQFLHSLTDGSEEQKKAIRKAFKEIGYEVGDMDAKKRLPIVKIGKKTNPIGMETQFVTKMRDERAEISRFVIKNGASVEDSGESSTDDFESDGLDEFAEETTGNPEPEADSEPSAADDDDDPWSTD